MGLRRSDFRGMTWEEYHFLCEGYLRKYQREASLHRKVMWAALAPHMKTKVSEKELWPLAMIDQEDKPLPDITPRDLDIVERIKAVRNGNDSR